MRLLTLSNDILGGQILGYAGVYTATKWLSEMFTRAGADVFEIGFGCAGEGPSQQLPVSAATSMLVAGEIDAICTQYVEAGAPFDLAAMSPHVVPVVSIGHDLFNAMAPLRAYLASPARHVSDVVVLSSDAGARAFRRMIDLAGGTATGDVDVRVLPLGIDPVPRRRQKPVTSGEVTFLWLGRFSETYKADLRPLLLAFREVISREGPPVRLVLAGADVSGVAEVLRAHAKRIGIDAHCTWYPSASAEVREACLANADVLVNVSDHVQETFGLVNLEAMARGLPVIAGAWSGFREIVVHSQTGLLVPVTLDRSLLDDATVDPYGSVSLAAVVSIPALIDAMTTLRTSEAMRQKMGAAGRQRVADVYATEVLGPQYIEVVKERVRIAQSAGRRGNPRAWMPHAFAHYGSPALGTLTEGHVSLDVAFDIVPDPALRAAMRSALLRWRDGAPQGTTRLDRIARATLVKLGVLEGTEAKS